MANISGIVFGAKNLDKTEINGKRVIEVGCCDFNGSIRPLIESWQPSEYIGVDILEHPSVDIICSVEKLEERFDKESFDVVISTEMIEHVRNWKLAISNLKNVCKPGGSILITTRSYGYPYHGYPNDFWRFEIEDLKQIFSDCEICALESDYQMPGVFIKVKKKINFCENNLENYELHSMVSNLRKKEIEDEDFKKPYFKRFKVKYKIKDAVNEIRNNSIKFVSKVVNLK
jgi:SAM-dependent methyltransferase